MGETEWVYLFLEMDTTSGGWLDIHVYRDAERAVNDALVVFNNSVTRLRETFTIATGWHEPVIYQVTGPETKEQLSYSLSDIIDAVGEGRCIEIRQPFSLRGNVEAAEEFWYGVDIERRELR
jgi:hypothetical protein